MWTSFHIHPEGRRATRSGHLTCRVIRMHWRVFFVIYGAAAIQASRVIAADGLRHFPQSFLPLTRNRGPCRQEFISIGRRGEGSGSGGYLCLLWDIFPPDTAEALRKYSEPIYPPCLSVCVLHVLPRADSILAKVRLMEHCRELVCKVLFLAYICEH